MFITYFEGNAPQIETTGLTPYMGQKNHFSLTVSDVGRGLRDIQVVIKQKDVEKQILSKTFAKVPQNDSSTNSAKKVAVDVDIKKLGLEEGEATLSISATDYSFRRFFKGNLFTITQKLTIDTNPPKITIIHSERYIQPGGTGIVIYTVDDAVSQEVIVNDIHNPGFKLTKESENTFISYFGMPYDATKLNNSHILATDAAGNTTKKLFSTIVSRAKQKQDRINIGDNFLSKKIPEFESHYPEMQGELIEKYLYANSKVRTMNNKTIHDLCLNPDSERHWDGHFLRMAGSGRAGFADHRTYYYNNKAIDKQVHLGMDIASTRRAAVKAAAAGKVIHSDYLGIYGNMIILDHGQGVFSLYSHLSQINVSLEDMVAKGDTIGNTGTSGMAGGDHLHFSVLINGIFVTPKEWWDPHWIDVTITSPIENAKF